MHRPYTARLGPHLKEDTIRKPAVLLVAAALLAAAGPLVASTLIERNSSFDRTVTFQQVVLCGGSIRLEKNVPYRVHVAAMGDGSVLASFIDRTGRKCEAPGVIAVLREKPLNAAPIPGVKGPTGMVVPPDKSLQRVQPRSTPVKPDTAAPSSQNFAKLGFGPNSRSSLKIEGQYAKLEIFSADDSHSILIGLLQPAVNKARQAAAAPSK